MRSLLRLASITSKMSLPSASMTLQSTRLSPSHAKQIIRTFRVSSPNRMAAETVPITYIMPDGEEKEVQAEIGENLLEVAHANDIDLEGACGGELACATCHLVFEKDVYDTLPEKLDEEDDMLDLAFELTDTSRLGCQICVRNEFAGIKVRIPDDGYSNTSSKTG